MVSGEGEEASGAGKGLRSTAKAQPHLKGTGKSIQGFQPQERHAILPIKRMMLVTIWGEPENQRQETLVRGSRPWSRLGI